MVWMNVPHLRRRWVVLAVLLMAGCGGGVEDPQTVQREKPVPSTAGERPKADPPKDERPKIVALGDSLTAGNGLLRNEAFPALLQQKVDRNGYRYEVVNAGVSGDTSAGGLRRLDWVMKEDVRVLIVALGANDGLRGLGAAQMKENLATIIRRAQKEEVAVILAGMEAPPNYGPEYAASFRQVYVDLAREHKVAFIPFLLSGVAGQSHLNQADGIHPTAQGAAMMADTVWAALQPVLDLLATS